VIAAPVSSIKFAAGMDVTPPATIGAVTNTVNLAGAGVTLVVVATVISPVSVLVAVKTGLIIGIYFTLPSKNLR
jgi:uncharacterized membrane protein